MVTNLLPDKVISFCRQVQTIIEHLFLELLGGTMVRELAVEIEGVANFQLEQQT